MHEDDYTHKATSRMLIPKEIYLEETLCLTRILKYITSDWKEDTKSNLKIKSVSKIASDKLSSTTKRMLSKLSKMHHQEDDSYLLEEDLEEIILDGKIEREVLIYSLNLYQILVDFFWRINKTDLLEGRSYFFYKGCLILSYKFFYDKIASLDIFIKFSCINPNDLILIEKFIFLYVLKGFMPLDVSSN